MLGLNEKNIRIRPHSKEELSHYSKGTSDIEYLFPFGWGELLGIANRGNYDLTQHMKFSNNSLEYLTDEGKKLFLLLLNLQLVLIDYYWHY